MDDLEMVRCLSQSVSIQGERHAVRRVLRVLACEATDRRVQATDVSEMCGLAPEEVSRVIYELVQFGVVTENKDMYKIDPQWVGAVEDALLTSQQFDVVDGLSDVDTAPEQIQGAKPEDIELPEDDLLGDTTT